MSGVNRNLSGSLPHGVSGQFSDVDAALRGTSGELETYRGITRNLRTGENLTPPSGYVVSDPGGRHVERSEYNPADLGPFVAERQRQLLDPGGTGNLGVFVDERTVDTDVSRHYTEPRAAFKAMRKRGRTAKGEMAGAETEQKSGYVVHKDDLIYNPHHPENYPRIMKGLMESPYA